jgi:hypothetical protein
VTIFAIVVGTTALLAIAWQLATRRALTRVP